MKSATKAVPKLTIPSPSMLHGLGSTLENSDIYRDAEQLFHDLITVYVEQVRRLEQLGCTYLQIDDTMFATLGDPSYRDKIRATAGDPEQRHLTYIKLINDALAEQTIDHDRMRAHLSRQPSLGVGCFRRLRLGCRSGVQRAQGGRPVPGIRRCTVRERSSRCGSCRRERWSFWASSRPRKANWRRRTISSGASMQAAKYVDMEQLCLSPQCGFASTLQGNLLTEDEQFAKLRLVVETAREVWG